MVGEARVTSAQLPVSRLLPTAPAAGQAASPAEVLEVRPPLIAGLSNLAQPSAHGAAGQHPTTPRRVEPSGLERGRDTTDEASPCQRVRKRAPAVGRLIALERGGEARDEGSMLVRRQPRRNIAIEAIRPDRGVHAPPAGCFRASTGTPRRRHSASACVTARWSGARTVEGV